MNKIWPKPTEIKNQQIEKVTTHNHTWLIEPGHKNVRSAKNDGYQILIVKFKVEIQVRKSSHI